MVAGVYGKIQNILPNEVYINTNAGIIYLILISNKTFNEIKNEKEVLLNTEYVVNETSAKLYGFASIEELSLFKMLIKIPKVGHTTALNICSELTIQDLYEIITNKDLTKFKKIKGLGAKSAFNIVMHLENKKIILPIENEEIINYSKKNIVIEGLKNLGFIEKQYKELLNILEEQLSVEDNIKKIILKIKG